MICTAKGIIYDVENLPVGIAIVTPIRDLDNNLSVRCSYCAKFFDISEDKLGNIVSCHYCDEELQVNDFTTDPIIIEDESVGVENNNLNNYDENIENKVEYITVNEDNTENFKEYIGSLGDKVEYITDNKDNSENECSTKKKKKKKGFFSKLFRK